MQHWLFQAVDFTYEMLIAGGSGEESFINDFSVSSTLCSQVKQAKQNFNMHVLDLEKGSSGDQLCLGVSVLSL